MPPLALCFPMFCRIVRKRVCMVFLFIAVCAVLAIGLFLFLLHGFGAIKLVCLKKHLKCAFLTKKEGKRLRHRAQQMQPLLRRRYRQQKKRMKKIQLLSQRRLMLMHARRWVYPCIENRKK